MQIYHQAALSPCGFIANGGEILPQEIMGTGDVWQWMCRFLSENVASSKWKCPVGGRWFSRRSQIFERVDWKCSIWELRKKSFPW